MPKMPQIVARSHICAVFRQVGDGRVQAISKRYANMHLGSVYCATAKAQHRGVAGEHQGGCAHDHLRVLVRRTHKDAFDAGQQQWRRALIVGNLACQLNTSGSTCIASV